MGELHKRIMEAAAKKHAEENAVGRVNGDPALIVTKLNERRKQAETLDSTLAGGRRRYTLASTAPHANRSTLGGA